MGVETSKNWTILDGDPAMRHFIQLKHNKFSGTREVVVDGAIVHKGQKVLDDGDEFPIKVSFLDLFSFHTIENIIIIFTAQSGR